MKKAVPIIALVLALFLLASCGSADTQPSAPAPTSVPEQAAAPAPALTQPLPTPAEEMTSPEADPAGGVNPELKEFLDSYEEFIDQYVVFMEKYSESGDTVAMLGDYLAMLQTLTEFEAALSDYDTDSMSNSDALYYSEVCLRCSQKLLSAVG